MNNRIDSISTQLSTISPRINEMASMINDRMGSLTNNLSLPSQQTHDTQQSQPIINSHMDLRSHLQGPSPTHPGSMHNSYSRCNAFCNCNCHKDHFIASPSWARSLVGVVLISWSGVLGRPICSNRYCQRSEGQILRINYYFPRWFIQRVVFLGHQYTRLENHRIHIRISRVIPYDSPVWFTAAKCDIDGMQSLFSTGIASPFDVTENGINLLYVSKSTFPLISFEVRLIGVQLFAVYCCFLHSS